jgi:hypothetical protein
VHTNVRKGQKTKRLTLVTAAAIVASGAVMVPAWVSDPSLASTYHTLPASAPTFGTPIRHPRWRRGCVWRSRFSEAQPIEPGTGSGTRGRLPVMLHRNEVWPVCRCGEY